MDPIRLLLRQYINAAWRRRWTGVVVAWLVCACGWAAVAFIPNEFESSARLYVDADAVLTPLLSGIAADSAPQSQLELIQRTLLSRPNLEKVISKTDLDLTVANPSDRERLIKRLSNDIRVVPQTRNLFTITYRDRSPKMAHDVVQTLLTIFVESATGGNRTDMENARRFLEHQISSYEQQLRAAEKRRLDFRSKYIELFPNDVNLSTFGIEQVRSQIRTLEGQLQDAISKRDALKTEVEKTPTLLVVENTTAATAMAASGGQTRLAQAQEQLRDLLLKDTDQHPDVIAQKKLIAELKSVPEKANQPVNPTTVPGGDVKRSVPNPIYDSLKVRLVDADSAVSSLQRQLDEATRVKDRLEKFQVEQPGLLAEFQNMDRDYGVLRKNYEELLGRLQSANIAQAADTQADKVKLQIVDPPEIPRIAVAPNRVLLLSAVLVSGMGAAVVIVLLLSQLDRSFSTVDDLRNLGLPVLGGISVIRTRSIFRRMMVFMRFATALGVLVLIYGGLVLHVLRSSA
jgi:polysaccharide chain length determinant protein (PEP-CTERM system associated)